MNKDDFSTYPVSALFPDLKKYWSVNKTIVLQADPGAGKSTVLPLFLMKEKMCKGKIIMLEPRRMAARSLARYMSSLCATKTGELIGYRVKGDVKCSDNAKIELVTEGVFVRMIQNDPFLEGISLVIMDEFHERNIFTDLSAAFLQDVQSNIRPDLKILIMSATPETAVLKRVFGNFLSLESEGRMFPVRIKRDEQALDTRPENRRIIRAVQEGIENSSGNILIFLPGEREIKSLLSTLKTNKGISSNIDLFPLYGRLSPSEQDKVLNPGTKRMIVAATSIAETSLTIPGISCVIDTGLERKPAFDANAGLTRLKTKAISRASAAQRAGRAGRLREGMCIRLWSENDERVMDDFTSPEILNADLAPLIMEILLWGAQSPEDLNWIDDPPSAHYYQAKELLTLLEIISQSGQLSEEGKKLSRYGVHPRLAHMMARARGTDLEQTACALASLLSEGDWLSSSKGSDIRLRLEYLKSGRDSSDKRVKTILSTWKGFLKKGAVNREALKPDACAQLLCHSYPDRIAKIRGERIYQLSGGSNCRLRPEDPLQSEDYLIAPLVGGGADIPACFLAAALNENLIFQELSSLISQKKEWGWDDQKHRLNCRSISGIASLPLKMKIIPVDVSDPDLASILPDLFRKKGISILPWSKEDQTYLNRIRFASKLKRCPENWPETGDDKLIETLDKWFLPLLPKGRLEVKLKEGLALLLDWEQLQFLKRHVPKCFQVPSGSLIRIDYSDPDSPALDVRLQEVFGLMETPLLAGEVPLLFRLLNPAQRPIQLTKDLKSFWDKTYIEVRKELRGRYPKHYWPENPYEGEATSRVRPKK